MAALSNQIINGASMGASFKSEPILMAGMSLVNVHIEWTGAPVGEFEIQTSSKPNPTSDGDWRTRVGVLFPEAPAGADGGTTEDFDGIGALWFRVGYNRTSGTGTANAWAVAKER